MTPYEEYVARLAEQGLEVGRPDLPPLSDDPWITVYEDQLGGEA